MQPPRMTPTGLSRYYGEGAGPCPEVEPGYYDNLPKSPEFYCNDRAERESGWDMTGRYDYRCADFTPVCLNALLYKEEKEIAELYRALDGESSPKARVWEMKAKERAALMNRYLWNEKKGIFADYDFVNRRQSDYGSIASYYPLYAGMASPEQAAKVMKSLEGLEGKGGLTTSLETSGKQWDAPYGWAPLQLIAVDGMRRYGCDGVADRVSASFLHLVNDVFAKEGVIMEKYDVVSGSSHAEVGYGNQEGFGWTNGAFLVLQRELARREGSGLPKES